MLRVNVCPSMSESLHLLDVNSGPTQVNWVMVEVAVGGLDVLLVTLWSETHPLVSYILSLMSHNARERRARVDWVVEY